MRSHCLFAVVVTSLGQVVTTKVDDGNRLATSCSKTSCYELVVINLLKCLCHDLCNLLFVITGIFYEEMQYIFKRKYSIFTGLSALKVTGYDIKSGIAN
jgi:hypothetical protein